MPLKSYRVAFQLQLQRVVLKSDGSDIYGDRAE